MYRFFIKLSLFLILGAFLLNFVIAPIYMNNHELNHYHGKWARQSLVIKKSHARIRPQYAIIGDSVANQLFNSYYHPASFTSNGAILVVGQYILAMNIYKKNPQLKAIFLLNSPLTLRYPFGTTKTYRSCILPFFTIQNHSYFTRSVIKRMKTNPLLFLGAIPYFKITNLVSDFKFKPSPANLTNRLFLKPYAIEYYKKFQEFSRKTGVLVKVILLPLKNEHNRLAHYIHSIEQQIKAAKLESIFGSFTDQIMFRPNNHFRDNAHFKRKYIHRYKHMFNQIMAKELKKIGVYFKAH